ncbi:unnamed protein product [Clonostachys rosea f. rosea IK726]|uniref:Uncharacterized protein n=1 Tax=Clonostachys rosea f. rosea IK726 TaxID=1349383 RepID=A0ACA9TLS1_BIOOC|nr:unnamed protein product [Clonostachys rosea f. rosea IK726]
MPSQRHQLRATTGDHIRHRGGQHVSPSVEFAETENPAASGVIISMFRGGKILFNKRMDHIVFAARRHNQHTEL